LSDAPQPGLGIEEGFQVAFAFVPAVLMQDVEEVSAVALAHSSFDGWAKAVAHAKMKEQTNSILLVNGRWMYVGFIEMDFS
jgi:hypothetical protein